MKRYAFFVLFLLVAVTACKDNAPSPKHQEPVPPGATSPSTRAEESHRLIERYNQLLVEGYKTMNMTNLQAVASRELAEKAYHHMAAISEGKSRLVSQLKKIDFVKTDCSEPAKCVVLTRELWDFAYADILTGQRSNEVKNYAYDVRYRLEIRDGHWMITEISATGEERKEIPSWGKIFKKG